MWRSEWLALSRRILGLLEAARFHINFLGAVQEPDTGVGVRLARDTNAIFKELQAFHDRHARTVPAGANMAMLRFFDIHVPMFNSDPPCPVTAIAIFTLV